MKTLILSYSYSGNTGQIADIIQELTGAIQIGIEPVKPYPSNYNACVKQAKQEVNAGLEPEIKPLAVNLDDYDTFFIGTPVWWYTFSPPIRTLLSGYGNWKGKTIYPFATHGGGIGSTFEDYQRFCEGANVKPLLDVYFNGNTHRKAKSEIKSWVDSI